MAFILLESSDKKKFRVHIDTARMSTTISGMLDTLGEQEGDDTVPIPLTAVKGDILDKVIKWAAHHKHDAKPAADEQVTVIGAWDRAFLNVEMPILYELISAANYLEMKGLMKVATKKIADMIAGKSPEQMREILGVENDLAPEEEEQIRNENNLFLGE